MTHKDYLLKNGWKIKGDQFESPFTKKLYSVEEAMEVECELKGVDFVEMKMNEESPAT